ncbi:hypothetical protein Tco_1031657 [Tanacetum coccineum]|uniref:Uncharacterized protein n=1 Tax=Tanacetum coccineum TaxID=301880 RepID=A0ABQ5GB05_9ASTR
MHHSLESTGKIAPSTYEVGRSSKSVPEQEGFERIFAFRQPTLVIWVDPKDDRVYTGIPTYVPLAVPVQTPPSLEWFRSLEREQKRATRENHDLKRQLAEERRKRLELTDRVARMESIHESRGG